ncbi:uncharacterized protein LOC143840841 [Paroedura picta]|uniref:uncharacterized protein LOC143840841 n=1 Tax=Paroedura picta TaxID=143630 RepID=UPI00405677B4
MALRSVLSLVEGNGFQLHPLGNTTKPAPFPSPSPGPVFPHGVPSPLLRGWCTRGLALPHGGSPGVAVAQTAPPTLPLGLRSPHLFFCVSPFPALCLVCRLAAAQQRLSKASRGPILFEAATQSPSKMAKAPELEEGEEEGPSTSGQAAAETMEARLRAMEARVTALEAEVADLKGELEQQRQQREAEELKKKEDEELFRRKVRGSVGRLSRRVRELEGAGEGSSGT